MRFMAVGGVSEMWNSGPVIDWIACIRTVDQRSSCVFGTVNVSGEI